MTTIHTPTNTPSSTVVHSMTPPTPNTKATPTASQATSIASQATPTVSQVAGPTIAGENGGIVAFFAGGRPLRL